MKIEQLPPSVRQIIESILDKHTTENTKFNNKLMLENIIECSEYALKKYKNQK